MQKGTDKYAKASINQQEICQALHDYIVNKYGVIPINMRPNVKTTGKGSYNLDLESISFEFLLKPATCILPIDCGNPDCLVCYGVGE